jgi:myosin-1
MDVLSLDQEVGAWDSVLLDPLTEDSFIANLHQRFKRDHIYVSGNSYMYSRTRILILYVRVIMFYFIVVQLWSACHYSVVTILKRYECKVKSDVSTRLERV